MSRRRGPRRRTRPAGAGERRPLPGPGVRFPAAPATRAAGRGRAAGRPAAQPPRTRARPALPAPRGLPEPPGRLGREFPAAPSPPPPAPHPGLRAPRSAACALRAGRGLTGAAAPGPPSPAPRPAPPSPRPAPRPRPRAQPRAPVPAPPSPRPAPRGRRLPGRGERRRSRPQRRRRRGPQHSMLYFQLVIMAGTVMLAYYFEYTDTFAVNVQGFFCHDSAYRRPYPGPERRSAVPPALLYSLAAGVPALLIIAGETAGFCLQLAARDSERREAAAAGDCCSVNPLVRRAARFLGTYAFGLFATDIFVNAGQVVTGNLAPHFLALCRPNYTALGCQQRTQFVRGEEACTGDPELVLRARKTFPCKEAALSVYAAVYVTMYITSTVSAKGTRLAKPVLCLGLLCLAFVTGLNRVAEHRNHWADVVAGFLVGASIAVFLVVCVVNSFRGRPPESPPAPGAGPAPAPVVSIPRAESPLEQNHLAAFAEVT